MKQLLFLLLLPAFAKAQDTLMDIYKLAENSIVFGADNKKVIGKLGAGSHVFVVGKRQAPYFKGVKIVSDSLVGYVFPGMFTYSNEFFNAIDTTNEDYKIDKAIRQRPRLRQAVIDELEAKVDEKRAKEKMVNDLLDRMKKMEANEKIVGVGIRAFDNTVRYDKIHGVDFGFYNWTQRTVKYAWLTLNAINPVGDSEGTKIIKVVGPIPSNETGLYTFDDVFYSNVIDVIKITKIEIEYMDGFKKVIAGKTLAGIVN